MKKKPNAMILDIYQTNKRHLATELDKDIKDRATHNSIAAYRHILHHMEEVYDLSDMDLAATPRWEESRSRGRKADQLGFGGPAYRLNR
jgi:hypothetical protein